jgi:rare lipoprotein A
MWESRWVVGFVCVAAAGIGLFGCQRQQPLPPATVYAIPTPPPCPPAFTQQGRASYYGEAHHGLTTASGEEFDKSAMTAAHRTLPLGSKIEVENLSNGRKVVVTVNDRGPYVRGRIVDLSQGAARQLGFTKQGVEQVKLTAVTACAEYEKTAAAGNSSPGR